MKNRFIAAVALMLTLGFTACEVEDQTENVYDNNAIDKGAQFEPDDR